MRGRLCLGDAKCALPERTGRRINGPKDQKENCLHETKKCLRLHNFFPRFGLTIKYIRVPSDTIQISNGRLSSISTKLFDKWQLTDSRQNQQSNIKEHSGFLRGLLKKDAVCQTGWYERVYTRLYVQVLGQKRRWGRLLAYTVGRQTGTYHKAIDRFWFGRWESSLY